MTIEKPADGKTPAWSEEDELEYQIGDMNGIAFDEEKKPVVVYKAPEEKEVAVKK